MSKKTKKKYRVVSKKSEKLQKDKNTAIKLIISLVVIFSLYFGMLRAGEAIIQQIYIWAAFIIALLYVFVCARIASLRDKNEKNEEKNSTTKLEKLSKNLLVLLVPIIFALLADYMLIVLGFADYFGI